MSYRSVLVNLDVDGTPAPILEFAADFAGRHGARLIGFCAADAPMPITTPESGALALDVWRELRKGLEKRFEELRAEFERVAGGSADTEWRQALDSPTRALASASRSADLVVTGSIEGARTGDFYRSVDPGSAALQCGRPVLVAAGGTMEFRADSIVIAWKDTREARRAVADAVPLLASAREVTVATAAAEADAWLRESLADVAAFLARHGIGARTELLEGADEEERLMDFVASAKADLVVSGAYGHSRLREWVFGGVTRSLLDETGRNRFMSS